MMNDSFFENPHRRYNPLTGEWVLVSPQRMKRPWQGKTEETMPETRKSYDPECYLCPGNRRNTGGTNPDYKDVFVFTNDFPALTMDGEPGTRENGLLRSQGNPGICRVICFSPDHSRTLAELSVDEVVRVVQKWKEEFSVLAANRQIRNIQIFENKGELLGCSNPHPHGQIWAESVIPVEIVKRLRHQQDYYVEKGISLLENYLAQEKEIDERIISSNEHFTMLVPFWAVWPYEVMIISHRHFSRITDMTEKEIRAFSQILLETTIRYDNLFKVAFPYSAGMMNAPVNGSDTEGWHFHFSFYPPLLRSATVRKFMVGYEMFANPQRDFTPEYAASILRELSIDHYKA